MKIKINNICFLISLLFVTGCSKNFLSSAAVVSFHAKPGSTNSISNSVSGRHVSGTLSDTSKFILTVSKIEISADGNIWTEILRGPIEIAFDKGIPNLITIGNSIPISEDEYHGVRVYIEPKCKIIQLSNGTSVQYDLNNFPIYMNRQPSPMEDFKNPIEYTTKNGYLTAFRTERGKGISIVLETYVSLELPEENWLIAMYVRSTRLQ
jgi:hypothetical protein